MVPFRSGGRFVLLTAGVVFASLCVFCTGRANAFLEDVTETRLENGLHVILLENHKAPVATLQIWYGAGSRKDPWGQTGLAHIFEHLMFKGTKQVSGDEFTREIQEIGGNFNAFTTHDYAAYFENVAVEHIGIPVRLEADRMKGLRFNEGEFKTEKRVVMEERKLRTQDRPRSFLMEQVRATAFQAQPYHWPVVGWMDDLSRIGYRDALQFYHAYYNAANAILVAVGDFDAESLLATISKAFEGESATTAPNRRRYRDPPQSGERRVRVVREASLPFVVMGFHVPNLASPDGYALEVISVLLSAGKSSRLYEHLVLGRRVAISAGAEYSLLSVDPGLFYVYAQPLPGKDAEAVERALTEEMEGLKNGLVGDRELQKAKNQLEAGFLFGQDSLFFQGMLLARYETVSNWQDIRKYLPSIHAVSAADVRRTANTYFQSKNRTVGILIPERRSETAQEGANGPSREVENR